MWIFENSYPGYESASRIALTSGSSLYSYCLRSRMVNIIDHMKWRIRKNNMKTLRSMDTDWTIVTRKDKL